MAEIKAAGLTAKYARTVGIAVDHRRQNKSQENFDANVARLNEYKSKLVIFDKKSKAEGEQVKTAAAFPIKQASTETTTRAVEEPAVGAYTTLRSARNEKKYWGIREKRAREKAEAEADKKKK